MNNYVSQGKSYASGELETLSKKAASGAGMAWGMAEEAAKSVKFLSAYELPGAQLLAHILPLQAQAAQLRLNDNRIESTALDALLCPIAVGTALADRTASIGARAWYISALCAPLLALPIILRAAILHGKILRWRSDDLEAYLADGGFIISGTADKARTAEAEIAEVARLPHNCPAPLKLQKQDGIIIDKASDDILQKFFLATTVPQTEASRLHGAGAGLSDND